MNDNAPYSVAEALYEALRPAEPQERITRLNELEKRIIKGEFLLQDRNQCAL